MKFMHRQPKTVGKVDFARVRLWVLNGWGQLYRQTIFLSAFRCPEFQALATRSCLSGSIIDESYLFVEGLPYLL